MFAAPLKCIITANTICTMLNWFELFGRHASLYSVILMIPHICARHTQHFYISIFIVEYGCQEKNKQRKKSNESLVKHNHTDYIKTTFTANIPNTPNTCALLLRTEKVHVARLHNDWLWWCNSREMTGTICLWGHSMSNQPGHGTHHHRYCSFLNCM